MSNIVSLHYARVAGKINDIPGGIPVAEKVASSEKTIKCLVGKGLFKSLP